MNRLARNLLTMMLVGSVLMVYGCESDKDGSPTRPPLENWRDINVTLQNMDSHLGQLIAFRVVSRSDPDIVSPFDELRAVARIDSLDQADYSFTMPLAVPEGVHRLDFWCDNDGNGWFDPTSPTISADHSYRIPLNATGDIDVVFTHPDAAGDTLYARFYAEPDTAMFLDVNQATWMRPDAHFFMYFTAMDPCIGHILELQVVNPDENQTVGYYRIANVNTADFEVVLPNVGDLNEDLTGQVFQIDFYVDADDSGVYDSSDFAWTVMCTTKTRIDSVGPNSIEVHADSIIKNFTYNTDYASGFIWP